MVLTRRADEEQSSYSRRSNAVQGQEDLKQVEGICQTVHLVRRWPGVGLAEIF